MTFRYGFLLSEFGVSQDPLSISVSVLQQFGIHPEMYQVGYTKLYFRVGQVSLYISQMFLLFLRRGSCHEIALYILVWRYPDNSEVFTTKNGVAHFYNLNSKMEGEGGVMVLSQPASKMSLFRKMVGGCGFPFLSLFLVK